MERKKKYPLFLSVLLVLLFTLLLGLSSTSYATSITINDFEKLLHDNGVQFSSLSYPSGFNDYLNSSPIILFNYNKSKVYIFKTLPDKDTTIGITGSGTGMRYTFGYQYSGTHTFTAGEFDYNNSRYANINYFTLDVNTLNFTTTMFTVKYGKSIKNYDFLTSPNVYGWFGLDYSNVQNSVTQSDFSSVKYLKNYLNSHILFCGTQHLYYNNNDLLYKWDGVWSGKNDGGVVNPNYGGTFIFSQDYLYYYYDSGLQEPLSTITIDLNGYYPQSLNRLGQNVFPANDGDSHATIIAQLSYDYSYYYVRLHDLIQMLSPRYDLSYGRDFNG